MIGYKDMTFCIAQCASTECYRKLTNRIREEADEWWGGDSDNGAPIAISDFSNRCEDFIATENQS